MSLYGGRSYRVDSYQIFERPVARSLRPLGLPRYLAPTRPFTGLLVLSRIALKLYIVFKAHALNLFELRLQEIYVPLFRL